jgi:hypothetical protein
MQTLSRNLIIFLLSYILLCPSAESRNTVKTFLAVPFKIIREYPAGVWKEIKTALFIRSLLK